MLLSFWVEQAYIQSAQNGYVQQVTGNGQKLTQPFLAQQDVAKGGTLVFTMGARPAK